MISLGQQSQIDGLYVELGVCVSESSLLKAKRPRKSCDFSLLLLFCRILSNRGLRSVPEWQSIATALFDRDLELAVINYDGIHALVFPCRRILGGWTKTRKLSSGSTWRRPIGANGRTHAKSRASF